MITITVYCTLLAIALLAFIAHIGYCAGERAERRRLGRPEYQSHWGHDEDIRGPREGDLP